MRIAIASTLFLLTSLPVLADCSVYRDALQRSACEKEEAQRYMREQQSIRDQHQSYYRREQSGEAENQPRSEIDRQAEEQRRWEAGRAERERSNSQALQSLQQVVDQAAALEKSGRPAECLQVLGKIYERFPWGNAETAAAWGQSGRCHEALGNREQAMNDYINGIKQQAGSVVQEPIQRRLWTLYILEGRIDDAQELNRETIHYPRHGAVDYANDTAVGLFDEGRYAESAELLEMAIRQEQYFKDRQNLFDVMRRNLAKAKEMMARTPTKNAQPEARNNNQEEYRLIYAMAEGKVREDHEATLRAAEAAIAYVDEAGAHSLEALALNFMGEALLGLKRFDEAESRFKEVLTKSPSAEQAAFAREQLAALEKRRATTDWRDAWRTLHDTARRMDEDDDADQAVAIAKAREALALAEQKGGAQHRLVAESRNTLAVCLRTDQQYPEAEQQYLQALREAEAADGKDSDLVAIIATELATLYDYRTRHAEALPLHRRALAIREKGNNLLALEKSLDLLVDHYRNQRQFVEAEPYSRRLVELAERLNGPDHPIVAVAHTDLGFILFMLKRYNEAEPLYLRALAIAEKNAAKQPRLLQGTLDSLANLYLWMKKPDEAARYKQRRDTLAKR